MATWQVTRQRDDIRLISGELVSGKAITVVIEPGGESASLFIPAGAYTPDYVRTKVEEYVANHAAIGDLTGEV
jgi:hypothetical protein